MIAAAWPLARQSRIVTDALVRLAEDSDAHVRFQAALALGNCDDQRAGEALARLVRRDGNDPWMRAAILSSAARHVDTSAARICSATVLRARAIPRLRRRSSGRS